MAEYLDFDANLGTNLKGNASVFVKPSSGNVWTFGYPARDPIREARRRIFLNQGNTVHLCWSKDIWQ